MIESCDTNLLLHAAVPNDRLHRQARAYFDSKASDERFVLCELVLVELYVLLRNPKVVADPLDPQSAVHVINRLRSNPYWRIVDYPGNLMDQVWTEAGRSDFPRLSIYDARLAITLRHFGVTRFATRNTKHFHRYGFEEVFDPTVGP